MKKFENFGFLKDYDAGIYKDLSSAEIQVKTNPQGASSALRQPFEDIVSIIEKKNGHTDNKELDLHDRINEITKNGWIKNFNKPVNYINVFGKEKKASRLHFIRLLLNSSVHSKDKAKSNWPRVDTVNTMKALQLLHTLSKKVFVGSSNDIQFDENYCPIGEYYIYDSYVPSDSRRSLCKREYRGIRFDSTETEIIKYAVIREYDKKSAEDDVFRLRNEKCFNEASKYSIGSAPAYMADTSAIKTEAGVDSYYICYSFKQEPHSLTNRIVEEMDYDAKLLFCKGLATCLSQLHSADTPIYHRLLSSESIYVSNIRNNWIPYIIKFDCAKIDAGDAVVTVFKYWEKAKERRDQRIEIYQPPECKDGGAPDDIDWSKVDIYSLGMLMACIFAGDLTREVKDLRKLKNKGCSNDILSLIDDMVSDMPEVRPSIDEVMERLA